MTLSMRNGSGLTLWRGLRAMAAVGAVALLMAACGGDGEAPAEPPFGGGESGSGGSGGGSGGGVDQDSAKLGVKLSSQAVTVSSPATVTVDLTNARGDALAGKVVSFSTEAGLGKFSASSALTDAKGQAVVILQPVDATSSGADNVVATASVDGNTKTATSGFQVTAVQQIASAVAVSLSSQVVTASVSATVTAMVTDANGGPVAGQVVNFSTEGGLGRFSAASALSDVDGRAVVTLLAADATVTGADKVISKVSGDDASLTASAGFRVTATQSVISSMKVALSSQTVTAGAPATVTATVTDSKGSVLAGQVVTFSTERGLGKLSAPSALTNARGQAIVTLLPADVAASGADTVVATISVNGVSTTVSTGFQLMATQVAINSFVADIPKLQPYEQTALTVRLSGVSSGSPVSVQLSSNCVATGRATLTPASATTSTGVATFTYRDQGCGAFNTVDNLQASVTGAAATAALRLTLTKPTVSSISFASATPSTIYLRGSGFTESSNVSFQVRDANGAGVPNVQVTLEPTTLAGGLLVDGGAVPVTKRTDSNGNVLVRVNSGTVPTPVRIRATMVGSTISTVSSSLAIAVGLPSQLNFSLSQGTRNIEGFDIDGAQNTYSIIASDRLGNPVPEGTAVNFVAEGGQVEAIRFTALSNGLSGATANFQSASPRPADGRITVTAYALGEKSFLDTNGDNVYTSGEDYQDLGDVFLDRLLNGTFDPADDQFISLSIAGNAACQDAVSPLLALDNSIPSRRISNTGVPIRSCTAGWGRAYVRRAIETVLSTSAASPVYGTALPAGAQVALGAACPKVRSLITSYQANNQPKKVSVYEFGSVVITDAGKNGVFSLMASDANSIAFNPMAAGTTITASATEGLSASVASGSPVASTLAPTGVTVNYSFGDTAFEGTVTITFKSPGGLQTAFSQRIERSPGAGTPCP